MKVDGSERAVPGIRAGWPALVLVAAGVLAYGNSLSGPFIWDDLDSIKTSPQRWIRR